MWEWERIRRKTMIQNSGDGELRGEEWTVEELREGVE